jgi:ABC-type Fe3+/spermidine/putrescine transport system ATPase subunit
MLIVNDVYRSYPELDLRVDFSVERGELVSILGPSGSGKTTTLRLVAGFERPERGRVRVDGQDVTDLPPEKRRVGFVFQDYTLFPHMDVYHNVAYGMKVRGATRAETAGAVERYLGLVGLSGYEARSVQTLSGGEQQRVAIARSLVAGPLLLLLDEPFSSIDTVLRRELRRQMLELQKELGITLVFVTHNQEEALAISDRVIVMREGRIAQIGTPRDLYDRPESRFVAGFVGEAAFVDGVMEGTDGEGVRVRGSGSLRVAPAQPPVAPFAPGTPVTVMVRPSRLRFVAEERAAAAAAPNRIAVRIVEREYYGHYYQYLCEGEPAGPEGARLVLYDAERREVGTRGRVTFRPEDAVLLPRGEPSLPTAAGE